MPLAAGASHTCAIVSNAEVRCWGSNRDGQLGLGHVSPSELPSVVPGLWGVVQISAGGNQTCALKAEGDVWCWGAGAHALMVDRATERQTKPTRVEGVSEVKAIATSSAHSCALRDDGRITCWGANHEGELGNGTKEDSAVPVPVALPWPASGLAVGPYTSCAFSTETSEIACWGMHFDMGAKDFEGPFLTVPTIVRTVAGVAEIAVAFHHVCARTTGGSVLCWGDNRTGQFKNAHPSPGETTPIAGLDDAVAIEAGSVTTCALRRGGAISCFGKPVARVIQRPRADLLDVGGQGADALAVGGTHACARISGGQLVCWGSNDDRQLGDGTPEPHAQPSTVLAPGDPPPAPADNGLGDACGSDADCTWDDPCAPSRCGGPASPHPTSTCAAPGPAPGSCACLHGRCLLHPASPPPPPLAACAPGACGLDEGRGLCLVNRGTATNPTSQVTEGPFCSCDGQSRCAFEWVSPVSCTKDDDCWIAGWPGPRRAIRRPPDIHRGFHPCSGDGDIAPACRQGICGFGARYGC